MVGARRASFTRQNSMREFSDNRHEITRRARETLARLDEAERRRRFEQQRGPSLDVSNMLDKCDAPMPIADYRGCKTTAEMTSRQFDQWCRDGKPALRRGGLDTVSKPVTESKIANMISTAVDRERANLQASLQTLAEIIGEECGKNEKALRTEIDALRTEISNLRDSDHHLRFQPGDAVLDLPNWRSDVEH
jgi:hypothetical protein